MVVLGGKKFLMSEVPIYAGSPPGWARTCGDAISSKAEGGGGGPSSVTTAAENVLVLMTCESQLGCTPKTVKQTYNICTSVHCKT